MDPGIKNAITDQGWSVFDPIGKGEFGAVYKVMPVDGTEGSFKSGAGKLMANAPQHRKEVSILYTLLFDSGLYHGSIEGDKVEHQTDSKFRHPGLVYYIDAFEVNDHFIFLVTDYFEGLTLMEFINAAFRPSNVQLEKITRTLLSTLEFIHVHNIIHRDVKLENIMFNSYTGETKLIDFGLSSFFDNIDLQRVGTPTYWPSEFSPPICYNTKFMTVSKLRVIDAKGFCKADIYALGIVLYEFATGKDIEPFSYLQLYDLSKNQDLYLFPDAVKIFNIDNMWLANVILLCLTPDPMMRKYASEILESVDQTQKYT
jgi:serine/threonine protein kinase